MNCYTNGDGDKYYCLDPVDQFLYCYWTTQDNCDVLFCPENRNINIIHREYGSAIEMANGNRYWYFQGKEHRLDGPAIEKANGRTSWYIHGEYIDCKDNKEFLKIVAMKAFL